MKICMALDRRTYAGAPVDIVRKLRGDAVHMKTRDVDAYLRAVVARLRDEQEAEIELDGASQEERCESFLAGIVRSGMATPVFQQEHLDASAIRVLRRARRLTQERLASLLGVSFATVNRWEAGDHLPSNVRTVEQELFAHFSPAAAPRDDEPTARAAPVPSPAPQPGSSVLARTRARQSFRLPSTGGATPRNRHV